MSSQQHVCHFGPVLTVSHRQLTGNKLVRNDHVLVGVTRVHKRDGDDSSSGLVDGAAVRLHHRFNSLEQGHQHVTLDQLREPQQGFL